MPITLRRMRGRASRETRRGPTSSATIGPMPNMTSGIAKQAIAQPRARGQRVVFADGERAHIAAAAPVEVAGGGVVNRVVVAPAQKR